MRHWELIVLPQGELWPQLEDLARAHPTARLAATFRGQLLGLTSVNGWPSQILVRRYRTRAEADQALRMAGFEADFVPLDERALAERASMACLRHQG